MMKKVCLFLLFPIIAYSQNLSDKNRITLGLVNQITYAPRFDIGYFRDINEEISVGATVGYGTYDLMPAKRIENGKDYQLFEIRPEIMYYHRTHGKTPHYASFEVFYIYHTDVFHNETFYKNGSRQNRIAFDKADYKRIKYGFNVNYGMIISFNKQKTFGIIPELGFGVKLREVSFANVLNPEQIERNDSAFPFAPDWDNYRNYEGSAGGYNFNFDFRVFYKF